MTRVDVPFVVQLLDGHAVALGGKLLVVERHDVDCKRMERSSIAR